MEWIKTSQETLNWTKLKKCQIYFTSEIMQTFISFKFDVTTVGYDV